MFSKSSTDLPLLNLILIEIITPQGVCVSSNMNFLVPWVGAYDKVLSTKYTVILDWYPLSVDTTKTIYNADVLKISDFYCGES